VARDERVCRNRFVYVIIAITPNNPLHLLRRSGKLTRLALCYNPHPRRKTTLANLSGIVKQLKKECAQVERQLWGLDSAIRAFANVHSGAKPGGKRRKMSAKGRARIAAAQRARWARVKGRQNVIPIAKSGKRTMSASARRKIAAAQRARWARVKRGKKAA
jgi:hypothetical protein